MRVVCDICSTEFEGYGSAKYCSPQCLQVIRKKQVKEFTLRHPEWMLFRGARDRSIKKNIEFSIEQADINIPSICPVLGIPLYQSNTGKSGFFPNSPSLDRKDPTKGYTKDNVRVISCRANLLKSNASIEEMEKILADLKALRCV